MVVHQTEARAGGANNVYKITTVDIIDAQKLFAKSIEFDILRFLFMLTMLQTTTSINEKMLII